MSAREVLPGITLLAVLGAVAQGLGRVTPVDPLVAAIAVGVGLAALVELPARIDPGVARYKLLLETGIVLLGASLTVGQLVDTGPIVVVLATGVIVFGITVTELLGRAVDMAGQTRSLLAAGASVCGVSAVVAVGSSIDGDEAAITYAAGTVLLFDAVTLVVFPLVGSLAGLPDRVFGVWAGLSLFSTGPAAAVGFSVSETAGQWATVTKLIRNAFIGVLAVGYATAYATSEDGFDPTEIWTRFPKFLIGFALVAVLTNVGLVNEAARVTIGHAVDWLFTLAFVGLGIELNPRELRTTGARPVAVVLVQLVAVSTLTYLAVVTLL